MAYEFENELEMMSEFEDEFEGEFELEDEMEGEGELEMEAESSHEGEGWLGAIGNIASSLLSESEFEAEGEFEGEDEFEVSPIRKIYPDAMMEHLGELAAEAESEEEAAEHFLPLIGMAASKLLPVVARAIAPAARRALPHIARTLTRATPRLTHGISKVAKTLHRNPQTRHLLRTVPGIARRTVGHIAQQVARGRKITPHTAVRTLARQARQVLGTKDHRVHALRRHNHLERRFHGKIAPGAARPHVRYRYIGGRRVPVRTSGSPGYARRRVATGGVGPAAGGSSPLHRASVSGTRGGPSYGVAGTTARGGACTCGAGGAAPAYCRCCGQALR
jgi:hypothetical protein